MRLAVIVLVLTACAAQTRQKGLAAALATTEASSRALLAYDHRHELELVDAAKDKPSAQAAVLGWHQTRDKIVAGLISAYEAIAIAETVNDDPTFQGALKTISDLEILMATLGINP